MVDKFDVNDIYGELREKFIIIGLTGALGSGCTESAKILSQVEIPEIRNLLNHEELKSNYDGLEEYRIKKIESFLSEKKWESFYHLKVSNLLFCLFFNNKKQYASDNYNVKKWLSPNIAVEEVHHLCSKICSMIFEDTNLNKEPSKDTLLANYLDEVNEIITSYVNKAHSTYTIDFQKVGEELRHKGLVEFVDKVITYKIKIKPVFTISFFIKNCIKQLRREGKKFFVIDAFRNLHEINYFKARYSNFYLFSINADETIRQDRILSSFGFNNIDYETITEREKNKNGLHSQNINECLSNGDVYISNNSGLCSLKYQLIKFVSLIRKPGLFTPSKDERNMQIALTARYNSGCISRQVGACVVGKDGYILGIGWNDVPESSIPCVYRSSRSLIAENNESPEFSSYEVSETFKNHIRNTLGSNPHPFCFKDIENKRSTQAKLDDICRKKTLTIDDKLKNIIIKEFNKNPTRERALHAEENAFLQSSKVGGGSVKNSTLYTTASPCQLCAKKAMQLGVEKIIFIDAYPDISNTQTLQSGALNNQPKLMPFSGVAESAFMKLYKPLINIKDEVESYSK